MRGAQFMGSEQPSKAANGGETPGAGSGSRQSDSGWCCSWCCRWCCKADGAAVGEKRGEPGSESIGSSSGIINRAVPSSGVGGGAVPEVRSQASHVRAVGAVEVVDTGLAEGFAREEAIAAVDEVEKKTNRTADEKRLAAKKRTYVKEFVDDYIKIKNVLDIKDNPVYRTAFEEWNRQLKAWRIKLVDTESEKTNLTTQVYNIVGFFSVFQGVVFTAVSQVSSGSGETCRKTWVPIVLSVIAALVTIIALQSRYGLLTGSKSDIKIYRQSITKLEQDIDGLLKDGKDFRFYKDRNKTKRVFKDCSSELQICVYVSVLLLTGIFILSYFVLLCDKLLI